MFEDKTLEELNVLWEEELNKWDQLGVEPNQVIEFNPVQNNMWIKCLTQFLIDKGVIEDEHEWVLYFKRIFLEHIISARETVEPQIREMKLKAAGVVIPNMAIPQGKIRKH